MCENLLIPSLSYSYRKDYSKIVLVILCCDFVNPEQYCFSLLSPLRIFEFLLQIFLLIPLAFNWEHLHQNFNCLVLSCKFLLLRNVQNFLENNKYLDFIINVGQLQINSCKSLILCKIHEHQIKYCNFLLISYGLFDKVMNILMFCNSCG